MLRSSTARRSGFALLTAVAIGCGGSTEPNNNGNPTGGTFKATIDGSAWVSAFTSASASAGGNFNLGGVAAGGSPTLTLGLYAIGAPGTYPIGVGGTVAGGTASISASGALWMTPLSGAAGTVTVTSVSPTRIAGTFSFSAPPALGQSVTNTRTVTAGEFDVPVTGPATLVVPDNAVSKWTGTIGANAFNASTIVSVTLPSSGTLTIGASNTAYSLNLILPGYTGVGTYALGANNGAPRTLQVTTLTGASTVWGGTGASNTGTVTITSVTATKIKGTISATLGASLINPNAGSVTLTSTFEKSIP